MGTTFSVLPPDVLFNQQGHFLSNSKLFINTVQHKWYARLKIQASSGYSLPHDRHFLGYLQNFSQQSLHPVTSLGASSE